MKHLILFIKGVLVGIGGVAPGLSGSVIMIGLGLYAGVIEAIATLFKAFRKNMTYLVPIGAGIAVSIVIFSRIIKLLLETYETQTRLAFFGLLLGTLPLFYREIKKHGGIKKRHYGMMAAAFACGLCLVLLFPAPAGTGGVGMWGAFALGFIGVAAAIIPGISGVSLLSALGLYESWLELASVRSLDLAVYIPAGMGAVVGVFGISWGINALLKRAYTATFAVLFGFLLSILPSVLRMSDGGYIALTADAAGFAGIALCAAGICASYSYSFISRRHAAKKNIS
jgi:putative membrane protein